MEHDALEGGTDRCTFETLQRNLHFCTSTEFPSTALSRCLVRVNEQFPPLKTFRFMYLAGLSQPTVDGFRFFVKTKP